MASAIQTSFTQRLVESDMLRLLRNRAWDAGELGDLLARQAWQVSRGDVEVAFDALDELLARYQRMTHGDPVGGPDRAGWFEVRGHAVWIGRPDPLDASCACRDYLCASLGICEHVLEVLAHGGTAVHAGVPALRWDVVRPLSGAGRWLDRVWWDRVAARRLRVPAPADDRATSLELVRAVAQLEHAAEPAVRALIERERGRPPVPSTAEIDGQLAALAIPLFPYQRDGVHRFLTAGRMLLADDMGLGKTAQAIASGHVLVRLGLAARVLVIAPSPLKWQWAREWERFTGTPARVVEGGASRRLRAYLAGDRVLVASYEQARRDWRELAIVLAPDVVILDEAQRIKNPSTATARAVKRLEPRWRLGLTGTPLENRLQELASVTEWVDDLALEPVWRLDACHTIRNRDDQVCGVRDLSTIRRRIEPVFLRRVRAEVIRQLPSRRDIEVPVAMTSAQHAVHEELKRSIVRYVGILKKRRLTREEHRALMGLLTEQRIACSGLALRTFEAIWPELEHMHPSAALLETLSSPKLGVLVELLRSLVVDQRRRVVVFSQWRRMLQLAEWAAGPLLDEAGAVGLYFSGQETSAVRVANLARFHDDPRVRVLWSTDAGAVGLNLQRAASCCINLELPWNPAVREQRVARVHRLGQPEPVEVFDLVALAGIERRIASLLGAKQALFRGLFDDDRDEIHFDEEGGRAPSILALVEGES